MSDIGISTPEKSPSRKWRSILFLVLLALWIVFMVIVHGFARLIAPKKTENLFKVFHKGCCWLFSLRCSIHGKMHTGRPTLFLSNHVSYLDVFILGGEIPGYFIAKSEVANWPILGPLAKIQNTLFFERKGVRIREQLKVMASHFNQQGNLILFPEGTSTDGERVEPFKSSLLQSVEMADADVIIQPVSIVYANYQGEPMNRNIRDHYAWYATMPFAPHFFSALGMGRASVELIFHAPVSIKDFETRKDCATHCFEEVSSGLKTAINKIQ